jgi:hypothetical protein
MRILMTRNTILIEERGPIAMAVSTTTIARDVVS